MENRTEIINEKCYSDYRRVFLIGALLNVLTFIFICIIFFTNWITNTMTGEESGVGVYSFVKWLLSDEGIAIFNLLTNKNHTGLSFLFFENNIIFVFMICILIAMFISTIISAGLSIYAFICYKKVVAKFLEKKKNCSSARKFKRKTGWYTDSNGPIFVFFVLLIWLLITQVGFKNPDFVSWCGENPLGTYFVIFLMFDIPLNVGLIIYLTVLLLGSIVSKVFVRMARSQLY